MHPTHLPRLNKLSLKARTTLIELISIELVWPCLDNNWTTQCFDLQYNTHLPRLNNLSLKARTTLIELIPIELVWPCLDNNWTTQCFDLEYNKRLLGCHKCRHLTAIQHDRHNLLGEGWFGGGVRKVRWSSWIWSIGGNLLLLMILVTSDLSVVEILEPSTRYIPENLNFMKNIYTIFLKKANGRDLKSLYAMILIPFY